MKLTIRTKLRYPNPKQIVSSRKYSHLLFPHDGLPGGIRSTRRTINAVHFLAIKFPENRPALRHGLNIITRLEHRWQGNAVCNPPSYKENRTKKTCKASSAFPDQVHGLSDEAPFVCRFLNSIKRSTHISIRGYLVKLAVKMSYLFSTDFPLP